MKSIEIFGVVGAVTMAVLGAAVWLQSPPAKKLPSTYGTPVVLTYLPKTKCYNAGNIRGRDGEFICFKTKRESFRALVRDIHVKISGKSRMMKAKLGSDYNPTIRNILNVYSPPTENDTSNYVRFVSKHSRIAPDKRLTVADINRIIRPMIIMEKGHNRAKLYANLY
jgi:hypothetical protein